MKYTLDGTEYSVEIIRKNNKNIYIRVREDLTIYVTASYFTTKNQIIRLLDMNQTSLRKMIASKKQHKPEDGKISFLGTSYDVIFSNLFDTVELLDGKIYVKNQKELQKWYTKQMKTIYEQRYYELYHMFEENISCPPLKFCNMKTRWGVCNRKSHTITLNTRLIEYPLCCLDYVIVHELSHLVHFNHSKEFWSVVEKYCPDYKKIRKILKD